MHVGIKATNNDFLKQSRNAIIPINGNMVNSISSITILTRSSTYEILNLHVPFFYNRSLKQPLTLCNNLIFLHQLQL